MLQIAKPPVKPDVLPADFDADANAVQIAIEEANRIAAGAHAAEEQIKVQD